MENKHEKLIRDLKKLLEPSRYVTNRSYTPMARLMDDLHELVRKSS